MSITLFLKAVIISAFLHALIAPAESSTYRVGLPNFNSTPITNPIPLPRNQILSSDAQEYIATHNNARKSKGVPMLQWDEKLAQYAQNWAEQRIDDCNHKHHSHGPYGENTLWEQYDEKTPAQVTQVWIDEEINYDHLKMECKCKPEISKCLCGHYTQLVWSSTQSVGCGNVTCNNQLGFLVVCSYNPPGNYVGRNPFQNRVSLPFTTQPKKKRNHKSRNASKSRRRRQRSKVL